jgi:endonuclease/exonuclease/phosphatase family metal-dependent hydrolase
MVRTNRFKVERSGSFWLSPTPEQWESMGWDAKFPRVVTWAELRDLTREGDAAKVFAINTHWDHRGPQARQQSASLMRQRIAQIVGDAPFIITGDFNCPDDSEPYKTFTADGSPPKLIDSYRVIHPQQTADDFTFHAFTGKARSSHSFRIDWILHSPAFRTTSCEIERRNENGRYPSDHFPLISNTRTRELTRHSSSPPRRFFG